MVPSHARHDARSETTRILASEADLPRVGHGIKAMWQVWREVRAVAARRVAQYPTLIDLLHNLTKVEQLPVEVIPPLLSQLSALQGALAARLAELVSATSAAALSDEDRLLTIDEAAERLAVTKDWLYHHAKSLPFTVRPARRQLRFSARGIERYIRQRQGR